MKKKINLFILIAVCVLALSLGLWMLHIVHSVWHGTADTALSQLDTQESTILDSISFQ